MHKFAIVAAGALMLITSMSRAQTQEKVLLRLKNASRIEAEFVGSDEEGNLTVIIDGYRYVVPRRDYKIAIMPLPPVLQNARKLINDSRYQEALALFNKQPPFWDFPVLRCRVRLLKARAEMGLNDYQAAIETLLPLLDDTITDQEEEGEDYAEARLALASAQLELGETENYRENLRVVMNAGPPSQAIVAGNKLGDYEISLGNFDQAALLFLRAVLYYDVSLPGRQYALERLVKILTGKDDARREFFANMLKQQYTASRQRQKNHEESE